MRMIRNDGIHVCACSVRARLPIEGTMSARGGSAAGRPPTVLYTSAPQRATGRLLGGLLQFSVRARLPIKGTMSARSWSAAGRPPTVLCTSAPQRATGRLLGGLLQFSVRARPSARPGSCWAVSYSSLYERAPARDRTVAGTPPRALVHIPSCEPATAHLGRFVAPLHVARWGALLQPSQ